MVQTILITGASGFIAAHVMNDFLDAGYHVRAAVRSEGTANRVRKTHSKYENALTFTIVPDIAVPGAFDEAVKGVDGIIHTASPFILNANDYQKELFEPAVNGTVGVLEAAKKFNPNVKKIVITSSIAANMDVSKGRYTGHVYTEEEWNPMTPEEAIKLQDPSAAYLVSKTLAEKAAYDFVEQEKPNFTVSTLTPPMVFGPISHSVEKLSSLNTSAKDIFRLFDGSSKDVPENGFWNYVDVRDLSKAHLLAYESTVPGNQRYTVNAGPYSYQRFVDIIRENFPALRDTTPEGNPGEPIPDVYTADSSKIKALGLTYRPMEETIIDAVRDLEHLRQTLPA